MTKHNGKTRKDIEEGLDKALDQSFPASDPPAQTNPSQGTKRASEFPTSTIVRSTHAGGKLKH
jgi:hypothetical protein